MSAGKNNRKKIPKKLKVVGIKCHYKWKTRLSKEEKVA